MIAGVWLVSGAVLFLGRFARRARVDDTAEEARDPNLLLMLGLQRIGRRRKLFGQIAFEILQQTDCPAILISRRG